MRKKIILLILLIFCAGTCGDGGSRTGNAIDVPLAKKSIGPEGGTICFHREGHPLDGAMLTVPENALDAEVEITLLWSRIPIFPDYSELSHSFSEVLKIEPEELEFAVPATVGLPTNIPDGTATATPVTIAIAKQFDVLEHTIPSDNDFSDDFGSVLAVKGGYYAFGGFIVDAAASSIAIIQPPLSMGAYTVTSGSGDPIEIHLNLVGRDRSGNQVDLDESYFNGNLPLQIGGIDWYPINIELLINNTTSMNQLLVQSNTGDMNFVTDHYAYVTTAGSIAPTSFPGMIELSAVIQVNSFGGMCPVDHPLCATYMNVPSDPFTASP